MANVFPEDLGDSQNGHAVGFTAYKSSIFAQSMGNVLGMAGGDVINSLFGTQIGVPQDTVIPGIGTINTPLTNITTPQDSVFMYVPAGGQAAMTWDQEHVYTDVKLARAVTNFLGVTDAAETAAGMSGHAINPRVEVLFQTTKLRQFEFTFLMAPQSQTESNNMKSIIQTFRKYSAPRLQAGAFFFESPSEWQIAFWYRNNGGWTENTNIPKIARSVLNRVNVSYPVPGGEYSTFSNGHPVSAMIQLKFTEMSIIHRDRIDAGY